MQQDNTEIRRLWVLNPGHEEGLRIAPEKNYTPACEILQMGYDLSALLCAIAQPQDFIWVRGISSGEELLLRGDGNSVNKSMDLPRHLYVEPWALDPHLYKCLHSSSLLAGCQLHLPPISSTYYAASHRQWSLGLLRYLSEKLCYPIELFPLWIEAGKDRTATSKRLSEGLNILLHRYPSGTPSVVVKRPFSSSGRGVHILSPPLKPSHMTALIGMCQRSGSISLEPKLEVLDNWAIEYYSDGLGRVSFVALSRFTTRDDGSSYAGNYLAPQAELFEHLRTTIYPLSLEALIREQTSYLRANLGVAYRGYIGVDLFTYRNSEGGISLHPCVEINVRMTMGLIAHLAYQRYCEAGSHGYFRIDHAPEGFLEGAIPMRLEQNQARYTNSGKLISGELLLTQPAPNSKFCASIILEP